MLPRGRSRVRLQRILADRRARPVRSEELAKTRIDVGCRGQYIREQLSVHLRFQLRGAIVEFALDEHEPRDENDEWRNGPDAEPALAASEEDHEIRPSEERPRLLRCHLDRKSVV